jgi:hypothetical protein
MKDHIRERSPSNWAIVIDLHNPAIGKGCSTRSVFNSVKRSSV